MATTSFSLFPSFRYTIWAALLAGYCLFTMAPAPRNHEQVRYEPYERNHFHHAVREAGTASSTEHANGQPDTASSSRSNVPVPYLLDDEVRAIIGHERGYLLYDMHRA